MYSNINILINESKIKSKEVEQFRLSSTHTEVVPAKKTILGDEIRQKEPSGVLVKV